MTWVDLLKLKKKRIESKVRRRLGRAGHIAHYQLLGNDFAIEHRGSANDVAAIAGCFSEDQYSIPQVLAGYANLAQSYYSKIVESGSRPLIIDCGANIGAASLWFRATYPGSHIIAVEPAADNFNYLTRNTSSWNIERYLAGIDSKDGSAAVVDPGYGPDGYRIDPDGTGDKIPTLSVKTLLSSCKTNCVPFILKVDIEGYEERLFQDQTDAIALFPIVIIEVHDWLMPGKGTAINFFKFHSRERRDYVHRHENSFSIDYQKLKQGKLPIAGDGLSSGERGCNGSDMITGPMHRRPPSQADRS